MAVKSGADCPPIGRNRKGCQECQHKEVDTRQTSSEGGLLSFGPGHHCVKSVWRWILQHTGSVRRETGWQPEKRGRGACFLTEGFGAIRRVSHRTLQSRTAWESSSPPDPSPSGEPHYSHLPWVPTHLCLSSFPLSLPHFLRSLFLLPSPSVLPLPTSLHPSVSFSTHRGRWGTESTRGMIFLFFHF